MGDARVVPHPSEPRNTDDLRDHFLRPPKDGAELVVPAESKLTITVDGCLGRGLILYVLWSPRSQVSVSG